LRHGGGDFDRFFAQAEPRLQAAFAAAYGVDHGREAAAEALSWAWEHWERVQGMERPLGYLFRVGQSRTRRIRRPAPRLPEVPTEQFPDIEPGLPKALAGLSAMQRATVVLVHGFGWSHVEVGEVLGMSASSVATHVRRALAHLRTDLKVTDHAS
jgi:DNA-directed RNA polymerase specialized sigma24 family protein